MFFLTYLSPPGSMRILKNDMKTIKNFFSPQHWLEKPATVIDPTDFVGKKLDDDRFQTHCDVLIIGGGGVGSSVAYWLKKVAREGLNVCVVEKDDTVRWHSNIKTHKLTTISHSSTANRRRHSLLVAFANNSP
jgi:FAD dependent oxidoreductase